MAKAEASVDSVIEELLPQSGARSLDDLNRLKAAWETRKLVFETTKLEWRHREDTKRRYPFTGVVHPVSVHSCIETLTAWTNESDEAVEVVFNSPGGSVFDGLALFDFVRGLDVHVTTRAVGFAASMASLLLQSGDERVISPNGYLMVHETAGDTWGKASEMRDRVDLVDRLEEQMNGLMAERSKLTAKQIRKRSDRKDWWLNAEEALDLGFVDRVG